MGILTTGPNHGRGGTMFPLIENRGGVRWCTECKKPLPDANAAIDHAAIDHKIGRDHAAMDSEGDIYDLRGKDEHDLRSAGLL